MDKDGPEIGEQKSRPRDWSPVLWYCVIAAFNAVFYVALGVGFVALGVAPPAAGPLALLPVLTVSYLGHKSKTFRSKGQHRRELPRFIVVSIIDLVLAALIPQLGIHARAPPFVSLVLLSVVVPLANVLIMKFWIFKAHGRR